MFLLGQTEDKELSEYLEAESLIYCDLIRGAQKDDYYNLTLKLETGFEWATTYCDFKFLLKADDDVFINPYTLIDELQDPRTPQVRLYMGRAAKGWRPLRHGKYGVSVDEYNETVYPDYCTGPAYVLSRDLVQQFFQLFGAQKRLKLEDVYVGTLALKVGAKVFGHSGFRLAIFGRCKLSTKPVAYHHSSIDCIEKLFNLASQERLDREVARLRNVTSSNPLV